MRTYTDDEIRTALSACGIGPGDNVLVHGSLMHLGRMRGASSSDLAARHFEALRAMLGENGTIVVPSFTFAFCRGKAFDPQTSPSEGMGIFSEYVRTRRGARRSAHPMQSVAAIGPAAAVICGAETRSSFDPGGPFDSMVKMGAKGLLLGAPMQSFSLVHLAEERCAVPYRYWKEFTAPYGDPPTARSFAMYVRDLDLDPRLDLSRIEDVLLEDGLIRVAELGAGHLKAFALSDFLDVTLRRLQADPAWLLQDRSSTPRS
jgi:aminoglycoside 3-N-acetyltransferase